MTLEQNSSIMNPEAFFKLSYGLYVVSSGSGEKLSGYISNAVFQVTAEPAQFAISCSKNNYTAELIKHSKTFSISVLKKDAGARLIGTFGYKTGRDINKFENVKYITGSTGTPILLEDSLAWFECSVTQTVDVGTHLLFTARIITYDLIDKNGEPLTYSYYREVRKGKAPKNAPTYIKPEILMKKTSEKTYKCLICGHIYDPQSGDPGTQVSPGTEFKDLKDDWKCPVCSADKGSFDIIE